MALIQFYPIYLFLNYVSFAADFKWRRMTGSDLTSRLLEDIQTSLALRAQIPYLDMLKELAEGGMPISTAMLNTSSNFGSFDNALAEVLHILHFQHDSFLPAPDRLPLPLSRISESLSENISLLNELFQRHIDEQGPSGGRKENTSPVLLARLETIHLAAI